MNRKLTSQAREDIARRAQAGEFLSILAREYQVSRDCIYTVARAARRAD